MIGAHLRLVHQALRREWRRAERYWSAPLLDEQQIADALYQLAPKPPDVLLVHSSLSACGRIQGGPLTVIRALRSWHSGTLAMPTHSYCYPRGAEPAPVFDPGKTGSVVGAITDAFWRQPGVQRSLHPTHSLAVEGPEAGALTAGHQDCDTPCGRGTPYDRLVQQNAGVLMFGATMHSYTLFHTAEDAAGVPYLYEPRPVSLRFRTADNVESVMSMRKHDMSIARSFREKDAWLEGHGLLRRLRIGSGELLFVPFAQRAHEALVAQLGHDARFLTAPGQT